MSEGAEDDTLPPDDDTPGHTLARFRQILRQRRDESAVRLLEVSDRLYTAQVRASKSAVPEERILALVQALTNSTEAHLLTLQEGYGYIDRLTSALQPAEAWTDSTRRLESVATDWDARLSAAREVWMRAAEEIPRQVAEASASVLRSVLVERRAATTGLLLLAAVVAVLCSLCTLLCWRTHALIEKATAAPSFSSTEDADDAGKPRLNEGVAASRLKP